MIEMNGQAVLLLLLLGAGLWVSVARDRAARRARREARTVYLAAPPRRRRFRRAGRWHDPGDDPFADDPDLWS